MDDLSGCLFLFISVGSDEVTGGLAGSHALMKVFDTREIFDIKELQFDGAVDGFDIAVIALCFDRDTLMDRFKSLYRFFKTIFEPSCRLQPMPVAAQPRSSTGERMSICEAISTAAGRWILPTLRRWRITG
jgi:hypothetical protein